VPSPTFKASLAKIGLGMGDVVKMDRVHGRGSDKDNKLDFAGLMTGYTKFFATAGNQQAGAQRRASGRAGRARGAGGNRVIAVRPHKAEAHPGKTHKGS